MSVSANRLRKLSLAAVGPLLAMGAVGSARAGTHTRQAQGSSCNNINITGVVSSGTDVRWNCVIGSFVQVHAVSGSVGSTALPSGTTVSAMGLRNGAIAGLSYTVGNSASAVTLLTSAFAGYGALAVKVASNTEAYNDPDGVLDIVGNVGTGSVDSLAGGALSVDVQYHAFTDRRLMRITYTLTHVTPAPAKAAPLSVTAWMDGHLGSGASTTVFSTSNGDQTVDPSDHWIISQDSAVLNGMATATPILLHVPYGPGDAQATITPVALPGTPFNAGNTGLGINNINYRYQFTVNPDEIVALVWFVGMQTSQAEAMANAALLADRDTAAAAGLFANLPGGITLNQITNWPPAPVVAGPALPVPLNNPLGLFALAGLLGFIGWRRLQVRVQA